MRTKATKIKEFLIKRFGLQENYFNVDVDSVSKGSNDFKSNSKDLKNRYFETLIHSVNINENWYSVVLKGKGLDMVFINEINSFLKEIGEEQLKQVDNTYSSEKEGLNDVLIELNGKNVI